MLNISLALLQGLTILLLFYYHNNLPGVEEMVRDTS